MKWMSGVGFSIKEAGVRFFHQESPHLEICQVKCVNDTATSIQNRSQAMLVYSSHNIHPQRDKIQVLSEVSCTNKLILLSNFNARVGCDSAAWPSVIGRHGVCRCNNSGLVLLKTCATHDLITNTILSSLLVTRSPE